jgi:hypothetical protein
LKQQNELQELQRKKREKKDQLKAKDVTEVWMRSKQKELNELERLEKQTLTKLRELEDRLKRLERQEEPVERKERLYIPEELVGQEGLYHSEEVIFTQMAMDWSEECNDDEPFDEVDLINPDAYEDTSDLSPDTNVEASAEFYQAQDPQLETFDDDDFRPLRPGIPRDEMQIAYGDSVFRPRASIGDDDDSVFKPRHPTEVSSTTKRALPLNADTQ